MTDEVNRFLAEEMGLCWHVWDMCSAHPDDHICLKCGIKKQTHQLHPPLFGNPDFSTWEGMGILWPWVFSNDKHPGWNWNSFLWGLYVKQKSSGGWAWWVALINPPVFARAVYDFGRNK